MNPPLLAKLDKCSQPVLMACVLTAVCAPFAEAQQRDSVEEQRAYVRSVLQSDGISAQAEVERRRNGGVLAGVTDSVVEHTKSMLPKLNTFGGELKYGNHTVVSKDGESVVSLIRATATADAAHRTQLLDQIYRLSSAGVPEASNFFGFLYDSGLFGYPQDATKAKSFFAAAANSRYQPAIYNLAVLSLYGRGEAREIRNATSLIERAHGIAPDSSARVCGLTVLLRYRTQAYEAARNAAQGCPTPISALALARDPNFGTVVQRIDKLKALISIGIDDGFSLIEEVAKELPADDPQYLYCKWHVLNQFNKSKDSSRIRRDAELCYGPTGTAIQRGQTDLARHEQVISSITAFVPLELANLAAMKKANRFHYKWTVPYLPFSQPEVDLFAPHVGASFK